MYEGKRLDSRSCAAAKRVALENLRRTNMRSPVSIGLLLLGGVSALACERAEVASRATVPAVSQAAARDPVYDAQAAHELLVFVNQARAQAGLDALVLDETLSRAAQVHG